MGRTTTFELLLAGDDQVRARARAAIRRRFGRAPAPLLDATTSARLAGFHTLRLRVGDDRMWQVARELATVDGVTDVDIVAPAPLDHRLADLEATAPVSPAPDTEAPPDWFHDQPRFPEAIAYARQEGAAGRGGYTGGPTGIRVGLLDTGYSDHPEVRGVRKDAGRNYVEPAWWVRLVRRQWRRDARDPLVNLLPFRWGSHGTGSASMIVGGDTTAPGDRTNGVFPDVELIPYRVSDSVLSFSSNLAHAAAAAVEDGCRVLSISHAQLVRSRLLEEVVREAYERGVLWVCAAGSHVARLRSVWVYPARFPETIAVTASTRQGDPWRWSHGGVRVEVCAPGYEIYRPVSRRSRFGLFGSPLYDYGWSEGSTYSTPITAAAAALWLAHHGERGLTERYPQGWQRVEAFRWVLRASATPHKNPEHESLFGAGLLNVASLLQTPLPEPATLIRVGDRSRVVGAEPVEALDRRIIDKELTYWTGQAKVDTADEDDRELFDYVERRCSSQALSRLRELTREQPDRDVDRTGHSERLKTYVRACNER